MAKRSTADSTLIMAATELDAELARFHEGVGTLTTLPLSSKKHLDRATKALNDLADTEQRLSTKVAALVHAVAATRDAQVAQLDVIRGKAEALKARSLELQQLMGGLEELGTGAGALNTKLQAEGPAEVQVADELGVLVERAQQLCALAREKDFEDVAHLADSMRQQLSAVRQKLARPDKSMPS